MDCSLKSTHKNLLTSIPILNPKTHYTKLHLTILDHYVTFLHMMSEQELPSTFTTESAAHLNKMSKPYVQELQKYVFAVPRLKELLPEGQHGVSRYRPVKELISFLVRLLYHKTGSIIDSCGDHEIKNLEKELRFLLTVLGDMSLLVRADEQEEFKNLLAEFEDVANEAGHFVHSLFFVRASGEMDYGIADVLNRINLLKANIIELSTVLPACTSGSRSTYISSHETSMVESLLVLDLLICDLEDLMNNRDDDRIVDVKDQIQTLHQGFIYLQLFIKDTGSPQDQLKEHYMLIGDLAHEAQHLIVSFLAGDAPACYLVNRLIHVNHKIEFCRTELPQITMEHKSGGLKVEKYFSNQLSSSLTNRNTVVDDYIVGFEDKMTYILDHLVGGGTGRRVVSIFGMPGLGKTALAKKLYNHPSVNDRFDKLSLCDVSQTYVRRNVLANILIHIASDQFCKDMILEMEEDSLVEHIHKTLKGRRYLIVLDDIWDSDVCNELFICFPDDDNGSRILFTTRNRDVAPPYCIMYALPSLSDGQCWEIIQKKVSKNQPCPPALVESGLEFAASCRGLPLATIVIAGILSTVDKEEREWEEVRRNLSLYILDGGDNSVMRILKLSYNHLPQHLKLCFLYIGVFFIDHEINVPLMKNLWIAEGFIHGENQKDAAEEYLKELIDRSLVIIGRRRSDGGPRTCVIHDLLRELCLKTYQEEKLTRFLNSKYLENVEDQPKVDTNSTTWMCCQYMCNRFGRQRTHRYYQIEVPDMRLLRVLYFDCSFSYLSGIEYLVCLKYLVVPDLSPSIGNLVNLEHLRVVSKKKVYLSSTIMQMKKLKYVKVTAGAIYRVECITSLTNKLEYHSYVKIRKMRDEEMLKCSPHLRRLKCFYTKMSHRVFDLSFLTRLESLTLRLYGGVMIMISLPSSIKKLTLHGYMSKLCRKTLSMIGSLENLEVLKLRFMHFEENRWRDTRDGEFQNLRCLLLHSMSFSQWNVGSSEHFPRLRQLELTMCHQLGRIPAEIGELPSLQIIGVDWWLKKSARRIQKEKMDFENEEIKVVMPTYTGHKAAKHPYFIFLTISLLSVYFSTATLCSNSKSTDVVDDL